MLAYRTLIFVWVLLAARVQSQNWRPCTDLTPLDLLTKALPNPVQGPSTQLQVVQSTGSRGLRLSGTTMTSLSFPASQIFTNCDFFPAEFSLVVTLKTPRLRRKEKEFIFSVVNEESHLPLLGLCVSGNQIHLLVTTGGGGVQRRLNFKDVGLDDDSWHTVTLAVTGPYTTLTIDCGLPGQSFPSALSTRGSRFFIGSRGRAKGRFSGLLRQLVLLPGSDATVKLCVNSDPSLAELSIPHVLKSVYPSYHGHVYSYETERLDYVEDYQDLYTSSETFDIEVFSIPFEGLFMATANRGSWYGSAVYKWRNGSFQLYQNISTREARAWKHFTINSKVFIVVANSREVEPQLSVIYQWNLQQHRFLHHQTLETHSALDWEAFKIHNHSFLVVANHRRDSNHNIHSVIYWWNPQTELFEENQTLSTSGAYDWEFFSVGVYHFLVVANTFDGQTTVISSTIYIWQNGCFQPFQDIPTVGATDWETFQINGRFFLVVANSQRVSNHGPSLYSINSTVYELNTLTQSFISFQDLLTHSAVDWEFFTIGEENFLVVANSHDGKSYAPNSVIYRWQGYEGFVPVHSLPTFGCKDWEEFRTEEGFFLMYSSATSRLSKVFKLKTY
eukprot:XP_011617841.1 PREDICTED: thrombospondin-type laminin G domain and EAR repeat-containing protein-like [Takifugu rubripes]